MKKDSKIFVAGHKGLVGSAIVRNLKDRGYENIITKTRQELDLLNQKDVLDFFEDQKPEYVFDAAARVGGIYANDTFSGDFIYENIQIQTNLINSSYRSGVEKFLFLGSVCIYPKFAEVPVKEESLLTGYLEPTNDAYAIAKISGIKMLQAYRKQYGFKSVSLMPSNLYGIGDNFHPKNGHVIPMREFLYADDLADGCIFAMEHFENAELINIGSGENVTIANLAKTLASIVGYIGDIEWDTTRPNGTPNRPLDYSKMTELGWKPKHSLHQGLKKTYQWFIENTYYDSSK